MTTNKESTGVQVPRLGYVKETERKLPPPVSPIAWAKKVRQMRRDPTVSLVRRLIIAPALASTISIESTEDAPEGAVELIQSIIEPLRIHIIDTAFRGCIDFGWQPYELIFDINDSGDLVLAKMKPLLQDFTEILVDKKTGAYAGLAQDDVEIDVENTFVHNWDVEGTDWYGEALMRAVEGPYDESIIVKLANNKYDAKIAGVNRIIFYPLGSSVINGVTKDNGVIATELLQQLVANSDIAIPKSIDPTLSMLTTDNKSGWEVVLLSDSGASSTGFIARQQYLDALKARAFGVPERAVLEGQFGTKAEAQAHGDMAVVIIEMRNNMLWQGVNWHIVNRILRFNYGPQFENTVFVKPAPLSDDRRAYFRTIYQQLLASPDGAATELDKIDIDAMRDALDIPTNPDMQANDLLRDLLSVPTAPVIPLLPAARFPSSNGATT